jgi:hypothetical protein
VAASSSRVRAKPRKSCPRLVGAGEGELGALGRALHAVEGVAGHRVLAGGGDAGEGDRAGGHADQDRAPRPGPPPGHRRQQGGADAGLGRGGDALALGRGDEHGPQPGAELAVHLDVGPLGGESPAHRDEGRELVVGPGTDVVSPAAVGLVEELREALGTPTGEEVAVHRRHPLSLVTATLAVVVTGDRWQRDAEGRPGRPT